MANPNDQKFEFGQPSNASVQSNIFATSTSQASNANKAPLFGTAGQGGQNIFGASTLTSQTDPNGGTRPLFGGNKTESPVTGSLFNRNSSTNPDQSQADSANNDPNAASDRASQVSEPKGSTNLFSTPNKTNASLFSGGSNVFGTSASNAETTTPANKPVFGGLSTTPAGPPPSGTSLFGNFQTPKAQATSSGAGSLFGSVKPSETSSSEQLKTQAASLGSISSGPFTIPKASAAEAAKSGLFSNLPPSSSTSDANKTAPSATPNLFGNITSDDPRQKSDADLKGTQNKGNEHPNSAMFGASQSEPHNSQTSTQPSMAPLFPNTTAQVETPPQTSTMGAFNPSTSNSGSLQPNVTNKPTSSAPTGASIQSSTLNAKGDASASTGQFSIGPAPSTQSRLKNKSMDDIITRWASDLTKYQKMFQTQAEKVAEWDRLLVENSNAISKLYSRTYQAERDISEIHKQLSAVESQQEELSQWLDRYELEVDEMTNRQMGRGDRNPGPDQERERTYEMASRISERLSEMGKDLTSMIEEVNSASASLNRDSGLNDPLTQIVRVLNGHLSQLQEIDHGATQLQGKISSAQREGQRLWSGGIAVHNNRAADDLLRSVQARN